MSDAPREARSFEPIKAEDLHRLAQIALQCLERAFCRHREKRPIYEHKLLGICLCQGAADHLVHFGPARDRGIHDFDLWAFYQDQGVRFWNRRASTEDFGESRFGRSPCDIARYTGRRVDVFWRTISVDAHDNPCESIRKYFESSQSACAQKLREKPAVSIWPTDTAGKIVWNVR